MKITGLKILILITYLSSINESSSVKANDLLRLDENKIETLAHKDTIDNSFVYGVKFRLGGRYDDVRMCVASPAGAKGGMAADISFFAEFGLSNNKSLHIDIPVFRPILFAASFNMLQFEPTVNLRFRKSKNDYSDFIAGPTLGVSLHYGPDYNSEQNAPDRTYSFFAMGPIIGGYFGIEFKRNKASNFEIGISPYLIPLFSINDINKHSGIVAGALIDISFRF